MGYGMLKNYCSLESAKKLVKAGIILKTEFCWAPPIFCEGDWFLHHCFGKVLSDCFPAPSFSEIWQDFEDEDFIDVRISRVPFSRDTIITKAILERDHEGDWVCTKFKRFQNHNPVDALVDFMVWSKEPKIIEKI